MLKVVDNNPKPYIISKFENPVLFKDNKLSLS